MNTTTTRIRVIEGRSSWRSRAAQYRAPDGFFQAPSARRRFAGPAPTLRSHRRTARPHGPRHGGEPVQYNGVAAEWISVPGSRSERILLYLPGGSFAFRFPSTPAAFAARLCRLLDARALIPDYRLTPEHPFPTAPDDCHAVYRWLLSHGIAPGNIALVGDSAGGCLALVTLHRLLQAAEPQPAGAVLLSPAVDCTFDSHSMVENEGNDPMFRLTDLLVLRRHYVPSPQLYTHPEVSPLFADFEGFAPLLQVGSGEMLRDEAVRTAHKAHASGVDVELELWPDTPHVFQVAPFMPESIHALKRIAAFVAGRTKWNLATQEPAAEVRAQQWLAMASRTLSSGRP
jgi:epsilon-lactone hydrolase